jgi:hypothetical protein
MNTITGNDVQLFVGHWLQTPQNGYLGSSYGQNTKALLQRPQNDGMADEWLKKLRNDVTVLQVLPNDSVNLLAKHTTPDRLDLMVEVAGTLIDIPTL